MGIGDAVKEGGCSARGSTGNEAQISSDCMSSLMALDRYVPETKLGYEIKTDIINLLQQGVDLSLKWTRAHVGTVGNEVADGLAKKGTHIPFI